MEIYLENKPWYSGIECHMRVKHGGYEYSIAEPLTLTRVEEKMKSMISQPFMTLEPQAAQVFMDQLWNCGVRPTEGTGSAGSLAATQHHLADMRKIVGQKLKVSL